MGNANGIPSRLMGKLSIFFGKALQKLFASARFAAQDDFAFLTSL